jgi:pimeloyl-ACP methyl ester carboxylesterase
MTSYRGPMMGIVGERSDAFFTDGARMAQTKWPGFTVEVIEGADHLLMLEQPDRFNRLLLAFLDRAEAAR